MEDVLAYVCRVSLFQKVITAQKKEARKKRKKTYRWRKTCTRNCRASKQHCSRWRHHPKLAVTWKCRVSTKKEEGKVEIRRRGEGKGRDVEKRREQNARGKDRKERRIGVSYRFVHHARIARR